MFSFISELNGFTGAVATAMLMKHLETVQNAQDKLHDSRNQRMTVELCLISMCDPGLHDDVSGLRARIEELERAKKEDTEWNWIFAKGVC